MNVFKKFSDRIDSLQCRLVEQEQRMSRLLASLNKDLDTAHDLVDEYYKLIKKPRHEVLEVRLNNSGEVGIISGEQARTDGLFYIYGNCSKTLLSIDDLRESLKQELYMQTQKIRKKK